jgi:hypothetical protein
MVRVAERDFVIVPYDQIDKFSYEYTKKHPITQGAMVMVASLGAGAIVMLTKSKSHWLYIGFHEQLGEERGTADGQERIRQHSGSGENTHGKRRGDVTGRQDSAKPADKPVDSAKPTEPAKQ